MSLKIKSPFWKNLIAILTGAIAAGCTFSIYAQSLKIFTFLYGCILGLFFTFLLGLPLYIVLPQNIKRNVAAPVISGLCIGALSTTFFFMFALESLPTIKELISGGLIGTASALAAWITWMHLNNYLPKPNSN